VIPREFLKDVATERGVTNTELEALFLAMEGQQTEAIASQLGISADAVRKRLSEIYHKFQIPGKGPVKLSQLHQLLVTRYQQDAQTRHSASAQKGAGASAALAGAGSSDTLPRQDWSEVPDVTVFYGRAAELATLEQWIVRDGCRLVGLQGLPGVGKTALAVQLAHSIDDDFECVLWGSLESAARPQELLADLLQFLAGTEKAPWPESVSEGISLLISEFRERRCLLVLDSVEAILRSGDRFGRYKEGYEEYGAIFRRLGQEHHQSCLLLISQEKLREIAQLQSPAGLIRSLLLDGLKPEEAKAILLAKGLTGERQWSELIRNYRGNPLALKLVAATIEEVFNKDVGEFVKLGTLVLSPDYRELLDAQVQRLSNLEKEVLRFLAGEDKPISFQKLRANLPAVAASDLIEVLDSLGGWRSLIEKAHNQETGQTLFALQPVVRKYLLKYALPNKN
jgi:hypothetical protein